MKPDNGMHFWIILYDGSYKCKKCQRMIASEDVVLNEVIGKCFSLNNKRRCS